MEKEVFPRTYLALRFPEFAEHFIQGRVLILEDGSKRIIRFTDLTSFRPDLSFVRRLLNCFYWEFDRHNDEQLAECLRAGADIVIDISQPRQKN